MVAKQAYNVHATTQTRPQTHTKTPKKEGDIYYIYVKQTREHTHNHPNKHTTKHTNKPTNKHTTQANTQERQQTHKHRKTQIRDTQTH